MAKFGRKHAQKANEFQVNPNQYFNIRFIIANSSNLIQTY